MKTVGKDTSKEVYSDSITRVSAVEPIDVGAFDVKEAHTYEFTVTFPDTGTPGGPDSGDNDYKQSSMSIQFDWTEVQK